MAVRRFRFIAPSHHEFHAGAQACRGGETIELEEGPMTAFFVERGQLQAIGGKPTGKLSVVEDETPSQPEPPPVADPAVVADAADTEAESKSTWPKAR